MSGVVVAAEWISFEGIGDLAKGGQQMRLRTDVGHQIWTGHATSAPLRPPPHPPS